MAATISVQETIVTPAKTGLFVQLYVSDAPRDSEVAAMRLTLAAPCTGTVKRAVVQLQLELLREAEEALRQLANQLDVDLRQGR